MGALLVAAASPHLRTTSVFGIFISPLDLARKWGRARVLPLLEDAGEQHAADAHS